MAAQRSFSKAAKRLGKSPQAVTRAVAALEDRLHARLLHRTTRSVSLTNDGEHYLERSHRALAELDALEAPLDSSPELRGTLSITAPVLFGQLHVAPIAGAFLDRHPRIDVRLALLDRIVSLAEEGIDVAVRIGHLADSSLVARAVGHVRIVAVASPKYLDEHGTPRSPESLAKHACIALSGTTPIPDRWTFDKRVVTVRPRWIVNTAQAAIDAAVAQRGIARIYSYQVQSSIDASALRIVLPGFEPPPIPVHLVYQAKLPRLAMAFVDHAAPLLRARLDR